MISAGQVLAANGMVTAFGHVSARVEDDAFLITPPKPPGSLEHDEELIEVFLKSNEMPQGVPGEAWIHWSIYRRRPEVKSICRAQPEFAGMAAIADVRIQPVHGHGAFLGDEVPVYDDVELIRSEELGERLAGTLGDASAIIIRGTGSVTVGDSVGESVAQMWALENSARINFFSAMLGEPKRLNSSEVSDWHSKKRELLGRIWDYLKTGQTDISH